MSQATRGSGQVLEEKTRKSENRAGDQTPRRFGVWPTIARLVFSPSSPSVYLPRAAVTRRHRPGARLSIISRKRERERGMRSPPKEKKEKELKGKSEVLRCSAKGGKNSTSTSTSTLSVSRSLLITTTTTATATRGPLRKEEVRNGPETVPLSLTPIFCQTETTQSLIGEFRSTAEEAVSTGF